MIPQQYELIYYIVLVLIALPFLTIKLKNNDKATKETR